MPKYKTSEFKIRLNLFIYDICMEISNNPLVTIATSMYNVEKYVSQNIESLIAQTYKNIEIIIVDDGSPDKSGKIADAYALKDNRIKVIHQQNKGLGGGRNTAIDAATGDYITFVDADDTICPDFVEYMLHLIVSFDADMAISKNCFTTSDTTQVRKETIEIYSPEKAVAEFFYPFIRLGAWNKLYRMSFIKKHALRFVPELKTGEGLEFITRVASLSNKIVVGNRKVYVYRLDNADSATTKANVERQGKGSLETMKYIGEHLKMKTKDISFAFDWHLWNCYRYCLRQIIDSGAKIQFEDLYSECIRYLRKYSWKIIFSRMKFKLKVQALLVLISPSFYVYLQIAKKRHIVK